MVTQSQNYRYSHPFFSKPSVAMRFERDMTISSNSLSSTITENCSKIYSDTCYRDACDSNGKNCHSEPYACSKTKHAQLSWSCRFTQLPENEGDRVQTTCAPPTGGWTQLFDFDALMLGQLRKKVVVADLKLERIEEAFIADFCEGRPGESRKIIRLQQGAGGRAGENDFLFMVTVGREQTRIRSKSGILNADIAYCGPIPVTVRVEAIEEDLFWDDKYLPHEDTVDLTENNRRLPIHFSRKTIMGEWFTDKLSEVIVTLVDSRKRDAIATDTIVAPKVKDGK